MNPHYDVIVLGLGGMGAATCLHLAQRGARVLGLEQFPLVHDRGSSHGESRIIRQAYFEHPNYVPLLFRAYELWSELERSSGKRLFHQTGLIMSGVSDGETICGAKTSASQYNLHLEELSPNEAVARWPSLSFPGTHTIAFESAAGTLLTETCVQAFVDEAQCLGANLLANQSVRGWDSNGTSVVVCTDSEEFRAASLVITAGAWSNQFLSELAVQLDVVRKFVAWYPIRNDGLAVGEGMPTYFFELPHGTFYGFPSLDGKTIKVAEHSGGETVGDPANVDRAVHPSDVKRLNDFVRTYLPGAEPCLARHSVCLYTLSPDRHFVVDIHPTRSNVVFAAGFSGHGFKFAPVMGEALADLVLKRATSLPIDFLSLSRFETSS